MKKMLIIQSLFGGILMAIDLHLQSGFLFILALGTFAAVTIVLFVLFLWWIIKNSDLIG